MCPHFHYADHSSTNNGQVVERCVHLAKLVTTPRQDYHYYVSIHYDSVVVVVLLYCLQHHTPGHAWLAAIGIPLVPICMFVNKICQNYLVLDTHRLCVTLYKSIYDKESIKNEKRCRDGVPKRTQTYKGGIKVKVNIQRPVPTSSL